MKRVLVLQDALPHYRRPLYRELSKHYELTVVHSGAESPPSTEYKHVWIPARRVGPFYLQSGVLQRLKSSAYDVVVANFDIRWINNVIAAFIPSRRFVYWGHRYSHRIIANKFRDFLMKRVDASLLYGEEEVAWMMARGVPGEKIFIAPNTIEVTNLANESGSEKDSFLFVGRAQKRKRVDELLIAFRRVLDRLPLSVRVDIVGAGAENDNLQTLAQRLGLKERVVFHGELLSHDALKPFFTRAFAYVSPGPVGLGVLHGFAYGVPTVTTYSGRHGPEFFNLQNGRNALLYSTLDELSTVLVRLANNAALVRNLGSHAFRYYVERRTMAHMVLGFREAVENERGLAGTLT
jgi:glycosyltransferase involved in cell wall biosynthesis